MTRLAHVALWVRDLERMRAFYVEHLGGESGGLYETRARVFVRTSSRSATAPASS